jgi:hypothetical protein
MIAANEFGLDRCDDSGATQELKEWCDAELGAGPSAFPSNLRNLYCYEICGSKFRIPLIRDAQGVYPLFSVPTQD